MTMFIRSTASVFSQENVFLPRQVVEHFRGSDQYDSEPRIPCYFGIEGMDFSWSGNDQDDLGLIKVFLNSYLNSAGKQLSKIQTSADRIRVETFKDGFGLMSLEGFSLVCQPLKA